jgi:uncharacterized protein YkwD
MKKLLISVAVIIAIALVAVGLMFNFGQTLPSEPTETPEPEEEVVEESPSPVALVPAATPTPIPIPSPTPDQTDQSAAQTTQTELNNSSADSTAAKQDYNGWPAIPESQLPQPDNASGTYEHNGSVVIVPSSGGRPQNGNYLGIQPNENGVIIPEEHASADTTSLDYLAESIFFLTNQERVNAGLKPLGYAYALQDEADTRAREASVMFSHTRPNGQSCHDIVPQTYAVTGENLILANKPIATAENLVASWMGSEGHRYNILLKDFTGLAVGVCEKDGVVYACQIFVG